MNRIAEDILMHYGTPRHSGRYPWGSGKDPNQHTGDFLSRVEKLKKEGWLETPDNIRKEFGLSTTEYRKEAMICRNERKAHRIQTAKSMRSDGLGYTEIGRRMGVPEGTVRSWLEPKSEVRANRVKNTADLIKKQIDEKGMIDVGSEVYRELNISKNTFDAAVKSLENEGYPVYKGRMEQATNKGKYTTMKVICPPGYTNKDIYETDKINSITEYTSRDDGETFSTLVYPKSMSSKRMKVRYAEEGGVEKDGIVEIRRGVQDLSLGESKYAQVRILVDDTHYIKGMAVYSDNMPDGVDIVFNTNKKLGTPTTDVLKKIKDDPDNPFGTLIKPGGQSTYIDKNGKEQLSLINKKSDQGDWTEWQDSLPSQFLSKQTNYMAKKQINLAIADKQAEYDEICSLTQPTVKKHFLEKFANQCDSDAVGLKAAALPGQKYHVIIPVNTLKDNEVYAPGYENGTKLALIRYPHGGTFEIPILTVNNKNPLGSNVIGKQSIDAVGINKRNADRLSGADFDGDTVMCIPTHDVAGKVKIKSTPPLKGLEGFEPKEQYGSTVKVDADGTKRYYSNGHEFVPMTKAGTQRQMGVVSNLITDMTLLGASDSEKAAAVRHSMVVIDAEKHKLDYKRSEIDNNIAGLKKKYQIRYDENGELHTGGASTLISRAKGQQPVEKRQGSPHTNIKGTAWYDPSKPEGSLVYNKAADSSYTVAKVDRRSKEAPNATVQVSEKGKRYIQFDGSDMWVAMEGKSDIPQGTRVRAKTQTNIRTQVSSKMAETSDAYSLVSAAKTPMEVIYADYANKLKSMANEARKTAYFTKETEYSPQAAKVYKNEVENLEAQLHLSSVNAPRERAANRMAMAEVKTKKEAYKKEHGVEMSGKDEMKLRQQAINKYRQKVGTQSRKEREIYISDRDWEAIQAGAIPKSKLREILNNADMDSVRQRAMPKSTTGKISAGKLNRIKSLSNSNYSLNEIAKKVGLPASTIAEYLKGGI